MKSKLLAVFFILFCSLILFSCKSTETNNNKPREEVTFQNYEGIDKTSVNFSKNNKISLIGNIERNKMFLDNNDGDLLAYRKYKNSYLKVKGNETEKELIFGVENKEYTLEGWQELREVKLSPKGEKVLYKKYKNDEVEFCLFNGEDEILEIDTLISGENYFWKDDNTIIYYGVNEGKNKNGIFSYDISSKEENLIYEIKSGIVEYMYLEEESIYFILNTLTENKELNIFSLKDKKLINLSKSFNFIKNIKLKDNEVYILGEEKNSGISLYSLRNGKAKKLIYDFPKTIDYDKGMIKDDNGNILFIGYNNIIEEEDVYIYDTAEKSIKMLSNKTGEYSFIEAN